MKGTALVTGGAVRLGRAFALGLAKLGYNVAIHFHQSESAAEATVDEIRSLGVKCASFQANFSQDTDFKPMMAAVCDRLGDLTVLVNSASVYTAGSLMETTPDLFDQQFAVNLRAPYFLSKAFAKYCQSGNIINIIDNKIAFNQYQYSAYLLSKKALAELTKLAAIELAPNIRVNGIAPGVTLPLAIRSEDYIAWRIRGIPLQCQGKIDYLLQGLQYILDNDFVTGQILTIDGGESLTNIGQNAENYRGLGGETS
ncbi:short-chain dehydrogenase/reductase SDR [Rippkaea orientalis PCC 8801]|uniref:Short-chain dehydrogenase/reductase SDR n=1 Tax=Rippkaea orientalis (strain PCC 8801 / RF-1) TaxID=41431 RepID=B7JY44_RIPO1|nr:SDR family NAD(P)-dependent oxidoreductase [Rippkaea orientalis]ACK67146.1 short-chain dehydrogenase/reductase SDR [Rippkaea orientalis PCC 8801]